MSPRFGCFAQAPAKQVFQNIGESVKFSLSFFKKAPQCLTHKITSKIRSTSRFLPQATSLDSLESFFFHTNITLIQLTKTTTVHLSTSSCALSSGSRARSGAVRLVGAQRVGLSTAELGASQWWLGKSGVMKVGWQDWQDWGFVW